MCDFWTVENERTEKITLLAEGHCPLCGGELKPHKMMRWPEFVTPSEPTYGNCSEHGCWRLESERIWHLERGCDQRLTLQENGYRLGLL